MPFGSEPAKLTEQERHELLALVRYDWEVDVPDFVRQKMEETDRLNNIMRNHDAGLRSAYAAMKLPSDVVSSATSQIEEL